MEVQVRARGAARVAQLPDHLAALHTLPGMDTDTARFEVRIKGEAALPQVEDDVVPFGVFQGDPCRGIRDLVRVWIDGRYHGGIRHREHRLSIARETGIQ